MAKASGTKAHFKRGPLQLFISCIIMAGLASSQQMEDVGEPDLSNGEQDDENSMAFSPVEGPTMHHCHGRMGKLDTPRTLDGPF